MLKRNDGEEFWCLSKWWNIILLKVCCSSLILFKCWCHPKQPQCTYSLCHYCTPLIRMNMSCNSLTEYQGIPSLDKIKKAKTKLSSFWKAENITKNKTVTQKYHIWQLITEDVSTLIENYHCLLDVPKENGKKKECRFLSKSQFSHRVRRGSLWCDSAGWGDGPLFAFSPTCGCLHGPVGAIGQGPQTADLLLKC